MEDYSNKHTTTFDTRAFDRDFESYLYASGSKAGVVDHLIRSIRRSTMLTQIPISLAKLSGDPAFGSQLVFDATKPLDFIIYAFLRVGLPPVALARNPAGYTDSLEKTGTAYKALSFVTPYNENARWRWSTRLGYQLVKNATLLLSEHPVMPMEREHMDIYQFHTVDVGKRDCLDTMIGDTADLTRQRGPYDPTKPDMTTSPATILDIVLPFSFSRESTSALPISSMSANDIRFVVNTAELTDLLVIDYGDGRQLPASTDTSVTPKHIAFSSNYFDTTTANPKLSRCEFWVGSVAIPSEEKARLCLRRFYAMEVFTNLHRASLNNLAERQVIKIDTRLSGTIKCLFMSIKNITKPGEHSVYSTELPLPSLGGRPVPRGSNALATFSLSYDTSQRMSLPGDILGLVQRYYHSPTAISGKPSLNLFSFALSYYSLSPSGSSNFSALPDAYFTLSLTDEAIKCASTPTSTEKTEKVTNYVGDTKTETVFPYALNRNQVYQLIFFATQYKPFRTEGGFAAVAQGI